ncbi:hypothetical protein GA0115239_13231, partial [Streptomyces sp. BpilaLS-43]
MASRPHTRRLRRALLTLLVTASVALPGVGGGPSRRCRGPRPRR